MEEVLRGVAGFRLYVSPVSIAVGMGVGATQALIVKSLWLWTLKLVALRAQGYRIK